MSARILTPPPAPPAVAALDRHGPDWREWVLSNLGRGCSPLTMLRDMVKTTWTTDAAADALDQGMAALGQWREWRIKRPRLPAHDLIAAPDGCTVRVLSRLERPCAALLDGLLSAQECEALIAYAEEKGLTHSGVVDAASGASVEHEARTSTSVFLGRGETPLVGQLEERLAWLTGWPVSHGEGLQVLRYAPGQEYKAHFDWFDPAKPGSAVHLAQGGQRVATTVVYLQTALAGGGTSFPKAGARVAPRAGGAIFFNDVDELGDPDPLSLHGGLPVEQGVKIVATYWQRERPFRSEA